MTTFELLTTFASIIALIISAVSLIRTRKTEAKQIELQQATDALAKKQLELILTAETQSKKARMQMRIEQYRNAHRFVVRNIGDSPGKNVQFTVDVHGQGENPLMIADYNDKFPISSLGPGDEAGAMAAFAMGSGRAFNVRITWENIDGTQSEDTVFVSV